MPNHTLAIVFRNPHPQRSPIRTELYLFRRDGSSEHFVSNSSPGTEL